MSRIDKDAPLYLTTTDGEEVGAGLATYAAMNAEITNYGAFFEWVASEHPDKVVQRIEHSYKEQVLAACKATRSAVDPETGKPIPGVTLSVTLPLRGRK